MKVIESSRESITAIDHGGEFRRNPSKEQSAEPEPEPKAEERKPANDETPIDRVTISAKAGMNMRLARVLAFVPKPPSPVASAGGDGDGPSATDDPPTVSANTAVNSYRRASSDR